MKRSSSATAQWRNLFFDGLSGQEFRARERQRRVVEACKQNSPEAYAFHVGIDLGKQADNTVISCIDTVTPKGGEPKHVVSAIDILPLKMDFTAQAEKIHAWHERQEFQIWPTKSAVDSSGLGAPVADNLRKLGLKFSRVVITSGDASSYHDGAHYIGRSKLITGLIAFLGREDTFINADTPGAERFKEELLSLRIEHKSGGVGYVTDGHDDTVMSVAMAVFMLNRSASYRTGVRPLF